MSNVNGDRSRADRLSKKKRIRRAVNRALRNQPAGQSPVETSQNKAAHPPVRKAA